MSFIVIVAGDVNRRFTSNNMFFDKFSHLGFACISEELFTSLPKDVIDSLESLKMEPTVFVYLAGSA